MTRVLLLGAGGFIGSHVDRALAGVEVARIGRDRLDLLNAEPGDVLDLLDEVRPTAVVNCTGALDGPAPHLLRLHAGSTAVLLEAVAERPGTRLVRIGSAGEYGPVRFGSSTDEDTATNPVGGYGVSHLAATHLVRVGARTRGIDAVSLRVFNPIGPGAQGESLLVRLAERVRGALLDGSRRVPTGPLDAWRDFVDVRDVAKAVVAAVTSPGPLPPGDQHRQRLRPAGAGRGP